MHSRTVATLLFAGCCLVAIGSMAGSLHSTVPGDPTNVIDVNAASVPLPADQVHELKDAVQTERAGSGSASVADPSSQGDRKDPPPAADGVDAPNSGQTTTPRDPASSQADAAETPPKHPVESRWRQLLGPLLSTLALLAFLAGAYYKREWLRARLAASLGTDADEDGGPAALSLRSPGNEVERLWLEMVSRVDQPEDRSLTPRERAEAVVRAGLNRDAVDDLTGLYESVRYGDRPVTDDLADEASTHLRRSTGESDD